MIEDIDYEKAKKIIDEVLSPASAVKSPEHLKGRKNNLREIDRALSVTGRHIFIFGDRGVGKTSLALTSAFLYQSSDAYPIYVACDSETTIFSLVSDIVQQAMGTKNGAIEKKAFEIGFNFKFLSAKKVTELQKGTVPQLDSLNECVDAIRYLTQIHSLQPIIVIDEFDRLEKQKVKRQFAEFLKKCGDDEIKSKFIVCGIAISLDKLLDEHLSIARNIASIELKRLSPDACWDIVIEAGKALKITFPKDMYIRIAQISDGFPHYVHLITEKILWSVFDDLKIVKSAKKRHFEEGIKNAVKSAEALPRSTYAKATQKNQDDYQEVLWAVADGPLMQRQTSAIYDSYCEIMEYRLDRNTIDKTKFYSRLNRLKTVSHESILYSPRRGWFAFSDSVVRGYVRLIAQENKIEIGDSYFNAEE